MDLFVKQSLTCVARNLTTPDYKTYAFYETGQTMVAEHWGCTTSQLNTGYFIEIAIFTLIWTLVVGRYWDGIREAEKTHQPFHLHTFLFWVPVTSVLLGLVTTGILNVGTIIFTPLIILLSGFAFLSALAAIPYCMKGPLTLWREYRANKAEKAEKALQEQNQKLAQLRAADPYLDNALKSLDAYTTALV